MWVSITHPSLIYSKHNDKSIAYKFTFTPSGISCQIHSPQFNRLAAHLLWSQVSSSEQLIGYKQRRCQVLILQCQPVSHPTGAVLLHQVGASDTTRPAASALTAPASEGRAMHYGTSQLADYHCKRGLLVVTWMPASSHIQNLPTLCLLYVSASLCLKSWYLII